MGKTIGSLRIIFCLTFILIAGGCGLKKNVSGNSSSEFNIITYNILHDTPGQKEGYSWSQRKDKVVKLIKKYRTDILCAQEDLPNQVLDIVTLTGLVKTGVSRANGLPDGPDENVAIYYNKSKFKLINSGHFWMSETPDKPVKEWDAYVERICNWASFEVVKSKKVIFVFNTHLDHRGKIARVKSAELIVLKIKEIAGNNPVILTGDMNATLDSEPVEIFKSLLLDSKDISQTQHEGPIGTFNGSNIDAPLKDAIDYIFVSKNLSILEHKTLNESDGKLYPSDHLPVFAKFIIN